MTVNDGDYSVIKRVLVTWVGQKVFFFSLFFFFFFLCFFFFFFFFFFFSFYFSLISLLRSSPSTRPVVANTVLPFTSSFFFLFPSLPLSLSLSIFILFLFILFYFYTHHYFRYVNSIAVLGGEYHALSGQVDEVSDDLIRKKLEGTKVYFAIFFFFPLFFLFPLPPLFLSL